MRADGRQALSDSSLSNTATRHTEKNLVCFLLPFLHCARAGADSLGNGGGEKGAGNGVSMSTPTLKCSLAWEEGHSLEVYPGLHLSRIWVGPTAEKNICSMHVFLVLLYKAPI